MKLPNLDDAIRNTGIKTIVKLEKIKL